MVIRAGELSLPHTSYSTLEKRPFLLPVQNSRAGPGGWGPQGHEQGRTGLATHVL